MANCLLHNSGNLISEIQYRQAVLTYDLNPQKSLDFIRDRLGLAFNHQKDVPNAEPDLPESLDQKLISREQLLKQAFADHGDLSGFTTQSFPWLIGTELSPDRRRHLLSQLDRPDFPGLAKLVVDDLKFQNSGGFGSLGIHQRLLLEQLQECATLMPTLLDQSAFVNVWLQRLAPGNDVNEVQDAVERDAHLTRLWDFVKSLTPAQNSLKAHILYQRLDFNRSKNNYDKGLFLEYIKLPRHAPYMNGGYMQQPLSQQYPADLTANYSPFTRSPVIGDDEPLIRDYLHRLLTEADSTREFQPFLNDTYLTHRFAETKIVNGLGNPEQWYALLPPADYQILRDRVDVVHAEAGSLIRVPCLLADGVPSRINIALSELRGGEFFADRFDAIRIKHGFAEISDLRAGDYSLLLRDSGQQILIRITEGKQLGQLLIGDSRILEQRRLSPLNISSIQEVDGQLRIKVENTTKLARVHIFANQFVPTVSHFEKLTRTLNPGVLVQEQIDPLSAYAQGRKIGDEYRYILDRRLAEKYPGKINSRPHLKLKPCAVR